MFENVPKKRRKQANSIIMISIIIRLIVLYRELIELG